MRRRSWFLLLVNEVSLEQGSAEEDPACFTWYERHTPMAESGNGERAEDNCFVALVNEAFNSSVNTNCNTALS